MFAIVGTVEIFRPLKVKLKYTGVQSRQMASLHLHDILPFLGFVLSLAAAPDGDSSASLHLGCAWEGVGRL